MGKKLRPEEHTPAKSKFSSWLQELIALDEIRKRTHQLMLDMDLNPYLCPSVIGAMYEMYRIMRPLCATDTREIMAERFVQVRADAEGFVREQERKRMVDPYSVSATVPEELRFQISWLFDVLYDLRHELNLGSQIKEKKISAGELLRRSAEL